MFVFIIRAAWDLTVHDTYSHVREEMAIIDFNYLLPFIGIAAYSIEGIGLLLPLRKDFIMSNHSSQEFRTSFYATFAFIVTIYLIFAVLNYLKFFDRVQTIIFYNYTYQDWLIFVLEVLYAGVS